jgi:hypothetical protein
MVTTDWLQVTPAAVPCSGASFLMGNLCQLARTWQEASTPAESITRYIAQVIVGGILRMQNPRQ